MLMQYSGERQTGLPGRSQFIGLKQHTHFSELQSFLSVSHKKKYLYIKAYISVLTLLAPQFCTLKVFRVAKSDPVRHGRTYVDISAPAPRLRRRDILSCGFFIIIYTTLYNFTHSAV